MKHFRVHYIMLGLVLNHNCSSCKTKIVSHHSGLIRVSLGASLPSACNFGCKYVQAALMIEPCDLLNFPGYYLSTMATGWQLSEKKRSSHSPNFLEHRVCFWNIFQNHLSLEL